MNNILDFDLLKCGENIFIKYKYYFYTYFVSLGIITIVYGSKLFFQNYATDDYARFFLNEHWYSLASWQGRWSGSILNGCIFSGWLHILPYFGTIFGLILISLSGLITGLIWEVRNKFVLGVVICATTISPYWANGLYFNTSVTVPIGILFSVFSVYLLIKSFKFAPIAILMSAFAIGIYQAVLQVAVVVTIGWFVILLTTINDVTFLKKLILRASFIILFLFISYIVSTVINDFIVHLASMEFSSRYEDSKNISANELLGNMLGIFKTNPVYYQLQFLSSKINYVNFFVILMGVIAYVSSCFSSEGKLFWIKLGCYLFAVFGLLLALRLPEIWGYKIPVRAFFAMATFLALSFVLTFISKIKLFHTFGLVLICISLLTSTLYISYFYDHAARQTQADIIRTNQIVTRIRSDERFRYTEEESPGFLIVGKKAFPVTGYRSDQIVGKKAFPVTGYRSDQQALNQNWSKYAIFEHFTDFEFRRLNSEEEKRVMRMLAGMDNIDEYPSKGSIQFIDNVVVLILNSNVIDR